MPGFADLSFPSSAKVLVDVGGGKFDASKQYVEKKYPGLKMYVVDPFGRSPEHNAQVWLCSLL